MLSCMVRNYCKICIRTLSSWKEGSLGNCYKVIVNMASYFNERWAFNFSNWNPTKSEILAASQYIQLEEKQRISRFVFQEDAKSSLIGRLLLRKYVHISSSIPYEQIRFGRDAHGKPYLLNVGDLPAFFNVSHQGDYAVLAGNINKNIGIDVMKVEPPANKDIPGFFRVMNRQFSPHEWATIRSFDTETEQIGCFYRLWCLKESYVKNIGLGINVPLDEISFKINSLKLNIGNVTMDTVLYEKGVLKEDYVFEETLLDDKHAVAVSLQTKKNVNHVPVQYKFLDFEELVKEAKPIHDPDENFTIAFLKKKLKPYNC